MSKSDADGINPVEEQFEYDEDHSLDLDTVRLLVEQAREGDQEAKSRLVEQVQHYLSIMADRSMANTIRSRINPSDIVQHTLINMVNGIENFRGATSREFYGWLNQIIRNESNKAVRDLTRRKRDVRREEPMHGDTESSGNRPDPADFNPTPGSSAIARERVDQFHRALARLPDDYQTVIRLRSLEEFSFSEIAERMNRSLDAVTKLWYRGIVKFQKEIEAIEGSEGMTDD